MSVLDTLTKRLDGRIRKRIRDRVDAMMREIDFLEEIEDPHLRFIQSKGWTKTRLNALCSLNSFYQIVAGPFASSARGRTKIGIGEKIPIKYGEEITLMLHVQHRCAQSMQPSSSWRALQASQIDSSMPITPVI